MYRNRKSTHFRNIYLNQQIYFFTSSIIRYQPILKEDEMKQYILKYWDLYRDKYSILIYGYVIMPDHIHIIIYGKKGIQIQYFIQQFLRSSSIALIKAIQKWSPARKEAILNIFQQAADKKTNYKVWKEQARGVPLDRDYLVNQRLYYIHDNPFRKGLVQDPLEYLYCSYRNYELNDHSIFRVDIL